MPGLEGMRTVVTGGAAGIGRAVVERFVADGARVASFDVKPQGLAPPVLSYECDVSDRQAVDEAVEEAAQDLGGIDVVVNNAGIGAAGDVAANPDEEWLRLYDVNVVGMARVARAALPFLRRSDHPCIINMSSIVAIAGLPDRAAYSATKGAVQALTMAMAADHAAEGIRVNCVNPSTVDTPWVRRLIDTAADPAAMRASLQNRQPTGRLIGPEEVAAAVAYLADPASPGLTGVSLNLDGGMFAVRPRR
ncbi:MAG TPA: SDR family oxidoreductase [Acidimicrobiia bacterium]|nr:SDR family oxidoreductase [Acidimicrobiia bacterium]